MTVSVRSGATDGALQLNGADKVVLKSTGAELDATPSVGDNSLKLATTEFVARASLGVGQTWQDVTASRALGTTYTNNTGKPIMVSVTVRGTASNGVYQSAITINGVVYGQLGGWGLNVYANGSYIIPSGATYSFGTSALMTLAQWSELR